MNDDIARRIAARLPAVARPLTATGWLLQAVLLGALVLAWLASPHLVGPFATPLPRPV
jgi:hypothetical protein